MWYFWCTIFVFYAASFYYSLYESSSPARPCPISSSNDRSKKIQQSGRNNHDFNKECIYPLLSGDDNNNDRSFVMELWIYEPQLRGLTDHDNSGGGGTINNDGSRSRERRITYKWKAVETCRFNITLPKIGASLRIPSSIVTRTNTVANDNDNKNGGNKQVCSIHFTDSMRERHWSNTTAAAAAATNNNMKPKSLRAKFLFLGDDMSFITEAPFELTRNVLRPNGEYVPYVKYGRGAAIRLRSVAEYRPYGEGILMRKDGVRLEQYNRTTYRPQIYVDDKSLQYSSQIELAPPPAQQQQQQAQRKPFNLTIKISTISPLVDSLNVQILNMMRYVESSDNVLLSEMIGGNEILDEIKYFLNDEKLYHFLVSQILSYVHMWLDYIAFRDEVRFYGGRTNKRLAGLSISSVFTRFICDVIILLYLLDGGNTSWIVIMSIGSSCAVEAWKLWKLFNCYYYDRMYNKNDDNHNSNNNKNDDNTDKLSATAIPRIKMTKLEQEILEYDSIAIRYLSMLFYPIIFIWSIYNGYYHSDAYRSWYSWLISNLANGVYTFGFVTMCPQLYINYRLKSVAHLPWKVFLYKIFNTFIDDVFAFFIVEMPMKHRIMTLRDDVVFLFLLIQVYMYRVDKTRTNEFGYSYQQEEEKTNENDNNNVITSKKADNYNTQESVKEKRE